MIRRALAAIEFYTMWGIYETPRLLLAKLMVGPPDRSHIVATITPSDAPLKAQVAIVALFPSSKEVSQDILSLISRLRAAECSVIAVSNRPLAPDQIKQLSADCHTIHIRDNVGRDFGAYKDAVLRLLDVQGLERLLLLNDSCHYLQGNLDAFIANLLGDGDFIGSNENFDPPYHLGSFALSFSSRVLASQRFWTYWKKYLPIPTRRWTIQHGEIGLSQEVIAAGFPPHTLYTAASLYEALIALPQDEIEQAVALVPRQLAERVDLEHLLSLATEQNGSAATWKTRLAEKLIQAVSQGSQVHSGAFLYARYLGSPLIKKDLLFRGVFDADQLYLATLRSNIPHEIVSETRAKHSSARGNWFLRRLRARGFI